ncbi:MAG TPA: sulfatase, partial [Verrucomicrobiaceae bacterium]
HPTIKTPNLNRMAAEGMRFTQFYSAAEVCTPSRAGLLTGRYPIRSGMCHTKFRVLRRESTGHLPDDEITIAQALKTVDYATCCIGKWHLGNYMNNPEGHPRNHGFDYYFGLPHSNDMNPSGTGPKGAPAKLEQDPSWWQAPLYRNEVKLEQPTDQTQLTRRYTEEAVKFIGEKKGGPFFLYLAHTFPHVPLFASDKFRRKSARGLYGDVVEELDWSVGEILKSLREQNLAEKTLVFFTSDNGPWLIQGLAGGSAGLLREGKGSTWEGGMREPGIAWWPGVIKPGVCRDIACTMDLFATSLKLAGAELPKDREIDGLDIMPLLTGKAKVERGAYFFYRGTELYAARLGRYKAHFITQSAFGPDKPAPHDPPLLYDLESDPGESFDVAAQHADVIVRIKEAVKKHKATVKPVPNQMEAVVKE